MDKEELIKKYKERIKEELGHTAVKSSFPISREYEEFKKDLYSKKLTFYEKACSISEKLLKIKPDKETAEKYNDAINRVHLNITPSGAYSLSFLAPIIVILFGSLISFAIFDSFFFVLFFFIFGLAIFIPIQKAPLSLAVSWRLKASNQLVQSLFYVVTYMRHTSNLERAIEFASDHLGPPLSLDFKKVLWNIETAKYENITESIEAYLATWRDTNMEFIEAFHLIISSLYEPSEDRRLTLLDKSLDVMLTETYEKMLKFAQNLHSPMTMLHMLGVIMPILGLVILPLVASFMMDVKGGMTPGKMMIYIATIYNVALPIGVYSLGKSILSKRPSGEGDTDISEENPELRSFKKIRIKVGSSEIKISPLYPALVVFMILFFIGTLPSTIHLLNPTFDISFGSFNLLGYICPEGGDCPIDSKIGPYGLGATLLSLFVTLAAGVGVGLYYKLKSKDVINIRDKTKKLEGEFASSLFQLGNRLGDGLPAEIAFSKVAQVMQGTLTGDFFNLVVQNINRLGMSIKDALFNTRSGALLFFPSKTIESSMKVLIESIKKGPLIAAKAMISISRYMREIRRVDERLKDLMAEIISSMKTQIKFMAPAISGIVVGITSMITTILTRLASQLSTLTSQGQDISGSAGIFEIFGTGVPAYLFQLVVGIYVVEIIFILTVLNNGIQNGSDKLSEDFLLGKNLIRGTILYVVIAAAVIIIFNLFAAQVMTKTLGA